ncbi:MAG: hypothetical protein WCC63_00480 [Candidatus Bathyarchaeia archaeon]
MSYSELVLPFTAEDSDRKKRFSIDMEIGALLCLAEADRRKKTGVFRGAMETLTILSKLHYPFWAVPWEDRCLLIDGTETASYRLQYFRPPDVEAFVEHLKRSSTVQELYRNTLKSHRETFSHFLSKAEIHLVGLIVDKELLTDFSVFMRDSQAQTSGSKSLIQPGIDMEDAVKIEERVSEHHSILQSEIKGMQYAIDALTEETKSHVEKLRQELEQTREKHEERIALVKTEVEKKTFELEKERDTKIEAVAAANKREVEGRLEEKSKWERELTRLDQDKSEYDKRKELRRHKKDEVGEARWDARLREVKNQTYTVKGKVKALSDFISRSNRETEKTAKNMRDAYERLIDAEKEKISVLESLRDSEIGKKEKEMEELRRDTMTITDKIERLIDQKREHASMLKAATIQWKTETPTIIHMPHYLFQYETDKEKRHLVHAPAVARAPGGLVMKIRKTLRGYSLQSKMGTLLKPRSRAIETMLTNFEGRLNRDKGLQRSLNQVSAANNLLASPDFKETVRRGVGELEAEGWVKPEEKEAILESYAAQ